MDVAIIKYNAGNIYSVSYALKRLGVEATITADPELLCKADKVPPFGRRRCELFRHFRYRSKTFHPAATHG